MSSKYSNIPGSYLTEVRSILVKEGFKNIVADSELATVHRTYVHQHPAEDAAYLIINQRDHYDNDDC